MVLNKGDLNRSCIGHRSIKLGNAHQINAYPQIKVSINFKNPPGKNGVNRSLKSPERFYQIGEHEGEGDPKPFGSVHHQSDDDDEENEEKDPVPDRRCIGGLHGSLIFIDGKDKTPSVKNPIFAAPKNNGLFYGTCI